MSGDTLLFLLLGIVAVAGIFFVPVFLTRRALSKVVKIFYANNALGVDQAKTLHELGLEPKNFMERVTSLRDYKPYALQILRQKGVIRTTEDGRYYLVEAKLDQT